MDDDPIFGMAVRADCTAAGTLLDSVFFSDTLPLNAGCFKDRLERKDPESLRRFFDAEWRAWVEIFLRPVLGFRLALASSPSAFVNRLRA